MQKQTGSTNLSFAEMFKRKMLKHNPHINSSPLLFKRLESRGGSNPGKNNNNNGMKKSNSNGKISKEERLDLIKDKIGAKRTIKKILKTTRRPIRNLEIEWNVVFDEKKKKNNDNSNNNNKIKKLGRNANKRNKRKVLNFLNLEKFIMVLKNFLSAYSFGERKKKITSELDDDNSKINQSFVKIFQTICDDNNRVSFSMFVDFLLRKGREIEENDSSGENSSTGAITGKFKVEKEVDYENATSTKKIFYFRDWHRILIFVKNRQMLLLNPDRKIRPRNFDFAKKFQNNENFDDDDDDDSVFGGNSNKSEVQRMVYLLDKTEKYSLLSAEYLGPPYNLLAVSTSGMEVKFYDAIPLTDATNGNRFLKNRVRTKRLKIVHKKNFFTTGSVTSLLYSKHHDIFLSGTRSGYVLIWRRGETKVDNEERLIFKYDSGNGTDFELSEETTLSELNRLMKKKKKNNKKEKKRKFSDSNISIRNLKQRKRKKSNNLAASMRKKSISQKKDTLRNTGTMNDKSEADNLTVIHPGGVHQIVENSRSFSFFSVGDTYIAVHELTKEIIKKKYMTEEEQEEEELHEFGKSGGKLGIDYEIINGETYRAEMVKYYLRTKFLTEASSLHSHGIFHAAFNKEMNFLVTSGTEPHCVIHLPPFRVDISTKSSQGGGTDGEKETEVAKGQSYKLIDEMRPGFTPIQGIATKKSFVFTIDQSGTLKIWDVRNNAVVQTIVTEERDGSASHGKHLGELIGMNRIGYYLALKRGKILTTGRKLKIFKFNANKRPHETCDGEIVRAMFDQFNRQFLIVTRKSVIIYDVMGKKKREVKGIVGEIEDQKFMDDTDFFEATDCIITAAAFQGKRLVLGDNFGNLYLYSSDCSKFYTKVPFNSNSSVVSSFGDGSKSSDNINTKKNNHEVSCILTPSEQHLLITFWKGIVKSKMIMYVSDRIIVKNHFSSEKKKKAVTITSRIRRTQVSERSNGVGKKNFRRNTHSGYKISARVNNSTNVQNVGNGNIGKKSFNLRLDRLNMSNNDGHSSKEDILYADCNGRDFLTLSTQNLVVWDQYGGRNLIPVKKIQISKNHVCVCLVENGICSIADDMGWIYFVEYTFPFRKKKILAFNEFSIYLSPIRAIKYDKKRKFLFVGDKSGCLTVYDVSEIITFNKAILTKTDSELPLDTESVKNKDDSTKDNALDFLNATNLSGLNSPSRIKKKSMENLKPEIVEYEKDKVIVKHCRAHDDGELRRIDFFEIEEEQFFITSSEHLVKVWKMSNLECIGKIVQENNKGKRNLDW